MKHPEVLLLPAMMIADYYLTIWASILRSRKYGHQVNVPHYEMNPFLRKDIEQRRWLNRTHLLMMTAATTTIIWLSEVEKHEA